MKAHYRIASRQSPLALKQSELVKQAIEASQPEIPNLEILGIKTQGDKLLDVPLAEVGGKGLFVKELEKALLANEADMAVHSMKDMTVDLPSGLVIAAILERADPRDVLVSEQYPSFKALPSGATVGTGSLRRGSLLRSIRPDLKILPLRGNVNTRLKRLTQGDFDALILAAAGLERLGLENKITEYLDPLVFIPAPAQGALGVQCREHDVTLLDQLSKLNHQPTKQCVLAERAVSLGLGGNCFIPLSAHATINDNKQMTLSGQIGKPDGSLMLKSSITGPASQAEHLGKQLAQDLINQGAQAIIDAC